MTAAYIGCIILSVGVFLTLVRLTHRFKRLSKDHQDQLEVLATGAVGIGGIVALVPVVADFSSEHHLLAALTLLALAALFLALGIFLPLLIERRENSRKNHEAKGNDRVSDNEAIAKANPEDR